MFVSGTRVLMSVDATRGFSTALDSRRMFEAPASILDYAVAPDGRLLVDLAVGEAIAQPLTVVSNWSSVIKN